MKMLMGLMAGILFMISMSASAKNFVIGVESLDYYPLYLGRGSSYTGYARDLLDEFAKASGHTFTYKPLPAKRLISHFLEGKLDFKYPDSIKWAPGIKKGHTLTYSDSTVEYIDGLMRLPANKDLNMNSFTTLGTLRGFTPWVYMDNINNGKLKVYETNNMKALVSMTESKRVQAAYMNVTVARYYMRNKLKNPSLLTFQADMPHARDHFSLSSTKYPKVIEEFNQFLKDNVAFVDKLKDKYQVRLEN